MALPLGERTAKLKPGVASSWLKSLTSLRPPAVGGGHLVAAEGDGKQRRRWSLDNDSNTSKDRSKDKDMDESDSNIVAERTWTNNRGSILAARRQTERGNLVIVYHSRHRLKGLPRTSVMQQQVR